MADKCIGTVAYDWGMHKEYRSDAFIYTSGCVDIRDLPIYMRIADLKDVVRQLRQMYDDHQKVTNET